MREGNNEGGREEERREEERREGGREVEREAKEEGITYYLQNYYNNYIHQHAYIHMHTHTHTCTPTIYRNLVIFRIEKFRTLLFRAVVISYAPDIIYETRVKVSLLKNIRAFNFRTDGSVRN